MHTRKPCPGCGQVVQNRRANQVCTDCKQALSAWAKHKAKQDQQKDLITIELSEYPHWSPTFTAGASHTTHEIKSTLQETFWKLLRNLVVDEVDGWRATHAAEEPLAVPRGLKDIAYPAIDNDRLFQSGATYWRIPRSSLQLIRTLWDAAARFGEQCYQDGVDHGRNLLLQLGNGELSIGDFSKAEVEIAKNRQESVVLHQRLKRKRL